MSMTRRRLLDDTYKRTASGNPIIARTVARMNPEINVYGWTKQDGTTGAQLLDTTGIAPYVYEWNWIQRLDDGSILVNSQLRDEYHLTQEKQISLPNGTYYATTGRNDIRLVIMVFIDGQEEPEYYLNRGFTVDDTVLSVQWRLQINPNIEGIENEIIYPMINAGSTALPWEPYTGGAPAPSPEYPIPYYSAGTATEYGDYVVNVNITGRNLFDASLFTDEDLSQTIVTNNGDGSFTVADSYTEWVGMNIKKNLSDEMTRKLFRPGTLHINCVQDTYPYFEINFYKNGKHITGGANDVLTPIQTKLTNDYFEKNNGDEIYAQYVIYSAPDGEAKYKPGTLRPMIYYEGNGDFEPYKEPQSIPITLDAPLSKWDRIEKRNGLWGVVRKSAEIVLDGSEDEDWKTYSGYSGFQSVGVLPFIDGRREGFSEDIIVKTGTSDLGLKFEIWLGVDNSDIYVVRVPQFDAELPDNGLQNWRDWLVENPLTILTYLDEETFEPFDVSQQEILNAIHTYNPSTSVFNWQNCDMDFTYKTRKSVENYE